MDTRKTGRYWYCVTSYGAATLCVDEDNAHQVARDCDIRWPQNGPHQVVQLVDVKDLDALEARATDAEAERDNLRAKMDELYAQKPIGFVVSLDWKGRESETILKITRERQAGYGFIQPLYTPLPTAGTATCLK